MAAGYVDLAVFLEAPSPPAGWVGGFLLSFLGSVLELMSVESQRGLGFGMRIQGPCRRLQKPIKRVTLYKHCLKNLCLNLIAG